MMTPVEDSINPKKMRTLPVSVYSNQRAVVVIKEDTLEIQQDK